VKAKSATLAARLAMTNLAMLVTADLSTFLSDQVVVRWHPPCALSVSQRSGLMIDSNVEQYVREHEQRVRRLDELYEKIRSPDYNDEEKKIFKYESLKLCLEGLATV
jgi:hypothetical protein